MTTPFTSEPVSEPPLLIEDWDAATLFVGVVRADGVPFDVPPDPIAWLDESDVPASVLSTVKRRSGSLYSPGSAGFS